MWIKKFALCTILLGIIVSAAAADTGNSSSYKLSVQENNLAGSGNSSSFNVFVDSGLSGQGNSSDYRISLGLVTFLATFGDNATTTPAPPLVNFTSLAGEPIVYQGTTAHFEIGVSNTGSVNSTIIPRLFIYNSGGSLVFSRTGSSTSLQAGSNVSLLQYNTLVFSVGSTAAGIYNATINIQFTNETGGAQFTQNRSIIFEIRASSEGDSGGEGGGSGGGGGAGQPPASNETQQGEEQHIIEFTKLPLVWDIPPGQEYTDVISIKNLGSLPVENIAVHIEGVPEEWIYISEPLFSMEPNGEKDIALTILIPSGASERNYQVRILIQNGGILNDQSFLLRVMTGVRKTVDSGSGGSSGNVEVRQYSVADIVNKKTYVTIQLKNGPKFKNNISYIRTINKSVASHVSEIDFLTPPNRIINPDPVVEWVYYNLSPYEEHNISYSVNKLIDLLALIDQPQEIIFYLDDEEDVRGGTEFTIINIIVILAALVGGIFAYRFVHLRREPHYSRGFKRFIGMPILGAESGKTLGLVKDITFAPETGEVLDIKIKNPTPYAQRLMRTRGRKNDLFVPFHSLKGAHDYVIVKERDIVKNLKWYEEFKES